ncbi:putative ORFan [Tupanvirus deep ocean]|uniref:ORFan n=2 Tax=Tupanvirus TaxID=2094720 RepID=A0AC62A7P6_9VIRU|nr:putative ORFan [Tupanvirus deep ocean]QKU33802.1 putative ORFan [Tupanvirus deep ocean]
MSISDNFNDDCILVFKVKDKHTLCKIFEIFVSLSETCMMKFDVNNTLKQKGTLHIYKRNDKQMIKCKLDIKYLRYDEERMFKIGEIPIKPILVRLNELKNEPILVTFRYDQQQFHIALDNVS